MDTSSRHRAIVAVLGLVLAVPILFDVWEDWQVQGEPLWLTLAENAVPLVLALSLVYVAIRLADREEMYAATVARWTAIGIVSILAIVGWVVGIQLIQGQLKPFVIASQTAVGGAVGGVLVGYNAARTEQARLETRREKRRWESLFDHAPDAIVDVAFADGHLRIRAGNEAFRETFEGDAVSTDDPLFDVTEPDADGVAADLREAVESQESLIAETVWTTDDGTGHFNTVVVPYEARDERRAFVILVDVGEMKAAQRKLEETVEQLERSNERLQEFAYVASHDLQEPLRMVSSYVDLLASEYEGELDEEADEYIEYAVDGAERMQDMIDALLQYSRVKTEAETFQRVDAETVFEDVRQDLEVLVEETDATVTAPDELPTVEADGDQLGQLLQNLVKNAIEHAGDEPTVEVSATDVGDAYRFAVSDDGPGIPEDQQERLFRIFEHGGDSSGTGIGLAVCDRIVDRHGGDIWVESEPGEGATFYFTVPKQRPQQSTSLDVEA